MTMTIRALTVRQPFADAITHGTKRCENRSRPIPRAAVGTTILIHAAQQAHASGVTAADLDGRGWPDTRGAVLAAAVLDSCHQAAEGCCGAWGFPGYWHWTLRDVTPLPQAVPARGALGLWTPPAGVLTAVQDQLEGLAEPASTGTSR
ncbi:hypothetical protein ACFQ7J_14245 [Streptomyces sp. NPDC056501]|uniref:hypothetical protein n=1 Tax=Streptomyces sp. NPDC056501 TaxID=3345841 RepID=UPI0036C88676